MARNLDISEVQKDSSGSTEAIRQQATHLSLKNLAHDTSGSSKIVAYNNSALGVQEEDSTRFAQLRQLVEEPQENEEIVQYDEDSHQVQMHEQEQPLRDFEVENQLEEDDTQEMLLKQVGVDDQDELLQQEDESEYIDMDKQQSIGSDNNSNQYIENQGMMVRDENFSSELSLDNEHLDILNTDVQCTDQSGKRSRGTPMLFGPDRGGQSQQFQLGKTESKPKTQQGLRIPIQQYLNATQHGQMMMLRNRNQSRAMSRRRNLGKSVNLATRQKSLMMLGNANEGRALDTSVSARQLLFQQKQTPSYNAMAFPKRNDSQNNDISFFINDNVKREVQELAKSKIKRKSQTTLNKLYINAQIQIQKPATVHQSKAMLPNISYYQQEQLKSHFKNNPFQRANKSVNAQSTTNIFQRKGGRPEQLQLQRNFYEKNQFMLTPSETAGMSYSKNLPINLHRREQMQTQLNFIQSTPKMKRSMKLGRPSQDHLATYFEKDSNSNSYRQNHLLAKQASKKPELSTPVANALADTNYGAQNNSTLVRSKLDCSTQSSNAHMLSRFGDQPASQHQLSGSQMISGRTGPPNLGETQKPIIKQTPDVQSGRTTNRGKKSQERSTMSLNKKPLNTTMDRRKIYSGSLVISEAEAISENFNKEQLVAQLTDMPQGPKMDKLYNQKAQLAVNLSTELYKAKKLLKDVIGSQPNRRSQNKMRRTNQKMVKSMKDCFVNPDIFSPTSDSNPDSFEGSKHILTEKKRDCATSDDVVIQVPKANDVELHSANQQGILILDEDKTGKSTRASHPHERSTFLDKIVKESTIGLESSGKRKRSNSKHKEIVSSSRQLKKAYKDATKVPLKLVEMKSKNNSKLNQMSKRKSGDNIISINQSVMGYNLTSFIESNQSKIEESNEKDDDNQRSKDNTNKEQIGLRHSENLSKIKQFYGHQKTPLIELIQQQDKVKEGSTRNIQSTSFSKKTSSAGQNQFRKKIVTPGVQKCEVSDNVSKINLQRQHEMVQQMKELDRLKKVHSDFQRLQNIGNYQGPMMNQIRQIISQRRNGKNANNRNSPNNRFGNHLDQKKQSSSQANLQYFFDQHDVIQICGQRRATSNMKRLSPISAQQSEQAKNGPLSKDKLLKNVHSPVDTSIVNARLADAIKTPPAELNNSMAISDMQKQIDQMYKQIDKIKQEGIRDDLKFQAKSRQHQEQAMFQQSLRKRLLSFQNGQLMVNTTSGEELYHEVVEQEKQQQSQERQRQERLKKQRELSKKKLIDAYNERYGIENHHEHLLSQLRHEDCAKCANSKNEELATVYKYKGQKPPAKYLLQEDPIERFYLQYVKDLDDADEDMNHIEMDPYDLRHPTFTHHVTCPCAKYNMSKLMKRVNTAALNSDIPNLQMPSQKRQMEAIDEINEMSSATEAFDATRRDNSIQALLLAMYQKCDCRLRYRESLLRRMRNQKLYHEFLQAQEKKNYMIDGQKEMRKKFNAFKMYGYQVNSAIQDSTVNSSQIGMRESISVDRALGYLQRPCRRTCSSIHNPMFHCKHFDIKLRYCRPQTARGEDFNDIDYDWFKTDIDTVVLLNKDELSFEQIKQPKELSKTQKISESHQAIGLRHDLRIQAAPKDGELNSTQIQVGALDPNAAKDELSSSQFKTPKERIIKQQESSHLGVDESNLITRKSVYNFGSQEYVASQSEVLSSQFELPQSEKEKEKELKPDPLKKMFRLNPPVDNLKLILSQLGNKLFADKKKQNVRILTSNEVENYYHSLKRQNIRNNVSVEEKLDLIEHCWNTLELLMKSLMLGREFEILTDSCKRKQLDIDIMYNSKLDEDGRPILTPATERNLTETILKVLVRLKKTYDATEQVSKILLKIQKRETLVNQLILELNECSNIRAKGYYFIILKISQKIHHQIERLRVDHPLLNRPFIYSQYNYSPYMVKDGIILRRILVKTHPQIKPDLDRVLDKSGKIVKLQHIIELNEQMEIAYDDDYQRGVVSENRSPKRRKKQLTPQRHGGCGHRLAYKLNRLQAFAERDKIGFFDDLYLFAMRNPDLPLED